MINLIDKVVEKFYASIRFVFICTVKIIKEFISWCKGEESSLNTQPEPLIKADRLQTESLFRSILSDIFDSPYYKYEISKLYENICKYVFSAVLINTTLSIDDIEKKIKNRTSGLLKKLYPLEVMDFNLWIAVCYQKELDEIHIYIANNIRGLDEITRINGKDRVEHNNDTFEESWQEYGK